MTTQKAKNTSKWTLEKRSMNWLIGSSGETFGRSSYPDGVDGVRRNGPDVCHDDALVFPQGD